MYRLIVIGMIILISTQSYSQEKIEISNLDTIPFKEANTILIKTGMVNKDALYSWGRHLTINGFNVDKYDDIFFSLSTEPRNTSKYNYDYVLRTWVADTGLLVVTIQWRLKSNFMTRTDATGYYDWDYSKSKNNVNGIIFKDIKPVLSSFGKYPVFYKKK